MDRCALAYQYRKEGYNCAQSVAAAFADQVGLDPTQMMAMASGFGGGVGGQPGGAVRRRQRRCAGAEPSVSPYRWYRQSRQDGIVR